jgi:hypothetical protein
MPIYRANCLFLSKKKRVAGHHTVQEFDFSLSFLVFSRSHYRIIIVASTTHVAVGEPACKHITYGKL